MTIDNAILAQLPVDSDVTTAVSSVRVVPNDDDDIPPNAPPSADHPTHLTNSFIPMPSRGATEQQTIQQSVGGVIM